MSGGGEPGVDLMQPGGFWWTICIPRTCEQGFGVGILDMGMRRRGRRITERRRQVDRKSLERKCKVI
jgi:hypothetical protein